MSPTNSDTTGPGNAHICAIATLLLAVLAPAVAAACEISASPISYGAIDPMSPLPSDSAGEIVVTCPTPTEYSVTVSSGGGSYAQRQMRSGNDLLQYQLFRDASRTTVLGDGGSETLAIAGVAGETGTTHFVYGRVPPQSAAVPGAYADTLILSVTY